MAFAKGVRPYALAILDAAAGSGELDGVSAAFSAYLACLDQEPNILRYLQWPGASLGKRIGLLKFLVGAGTKSERLLFGLLRILLKRGKIKDAGKVLAAYGLLRDAREGTAEALVESAWELDAGAQSAARALIEREFYPSGGALKRPNLRYKKVVDPDLIGGLRLRIGDRQFDDSLRARLDRMARSLR